MPTETDARLDDVIEEAREALLARQTEDGHWVYELEADATIPAEYILLDHFLDEKIHIRRDFIRAQHFARVRGAYSWHFAYQGFPDGFPEGINIAANINLFPIQLFR